MINHNSEKEEFYNRHEHFTDRAYDSPDLLPDRYVFIITNLCNLRCPFCIQKKHMIKNHMTESDWITVADTLPPYARVTLTGGEPFLSPAFKPVFTYIAERFDCNIITNGTLLSEEILELLLSYPRLKVISLSVDDIGNTLRNLEGEQWEHMEQMIRLLLKKRSLNASSLVLDVKTMILDENADNLFKIYKYCVENLQCDTHSFQFLKGSPLQHADYMFKMEEMYRESRAYIYRRFEMIKAQLEKVRHYNITNNRRSFLHPPAHSLTAASSNSFLESMNSGTHNKHHFSPCKFPWSSVHINSDGNLFPCLAIPMGNVKEKPLTEIIFGPRYMEFKRIIKEEGTVEACNRCGWLRPIPSLS